MKSTKKSKRNDSIWIDVDFDFESANRKLKQNSRVRVGIYGHGIIAARIIQ